MNFCRNCGGRLEGDPSVCSSCGAPVPVKTQPQETKPSFRFTRKTGILIISTFAFLILLFAGYQIGQSMTDKGRVLKNFQEAVIKEDKATLIHLISSVDPRLQMDEKAAESMLEYFKSNPSFINFVMEDLEQQSKVIDKEEEKPGKKSKEASAEPMASDRFHDSLYVLKKEGSQYLFFDRYVLEVQPFFFYVNTKLKDTKIYLDEKEIAVASEDNFRVELGPYLPGNYTLKAVYNGEYTNLISEKKIELFDPSSNFTEFDLTHPVHYVQPQSNFPDAKIFVNGADTGKTVAEGVRIGPVSLDGSTKIYVEKEFPWGKVPSKEVAIDQDGRVRLEIDPINDALKTQLMKTANDYFTEWGQAYSAMDVSKFKNATASHNEKHKESMEYYKANDTHWKGKLMKTIYDLDYFESWTDSGNHRASLIVDAVYDADWYDGTETPETTQSDNYWNVYLVYQDGKWLVESMSSRYGMRSDNQKVFDF